MESSKNQHFVPFHPSEHGADDHGPASHLVNVDPSGHANMSSRSSNIFSENKPVLNYSIQTGEEFALEFMRDRVNPRKPSIPNAPGDSSYPPVYMELKGILGISHTGSEAGSDISMLASAENSTRGFEPHSLSSLGNQGNHRSSFDSVQPVPHALSDSNIHPTLTHTTSGASDSSSTKLKILCSFGGRILPRPSDGKLRYVGGETRIIRINKHITWKDLWQKASLIYDETCAIKYQLPGEDLDALVSISSDEDLLNMMEECNIGEDGEGSKRLRMFLFSPGDLDDAHFTLANSDGDAEMKYVVAVNGMDFGSRKRSTLRGLSNSSRSNLNELDALNADGDPSTATELMGFSNSNLSGFNALPAAIDPSNYVAPTFNIAETGLHMYHGQSVHYDHERRHSPQFGYDFQSPYDMASDSTATQSFYGHEGKTLDSSGTMGAVPVQEKQAKMKVDSFPEPDSGNDYITSQAHSDNTKGSFPVEESSILATNLDREFSAKALRGNAMAGESAHVSKPLDTVTQTELHTSDSKEQSTFDTAPVSDSINSKSDIADLSYIGSPIAPQRVFRSVWIPREQAELHSRISKSDDSHASQFLVNQAQTDHSEQATNATSVENLQKGNMAIPTQPSSSSEKPFPEEPETLQDGVSTTQKPKPAEHLENQVLKGETEPGLNNTAVSHENSMKQSDECNPWAGGVQTHFVLSDTHGYPQPSTRTATEEESNVDLPKNEQGDILIDINDRFPRDLLSDIFSKAVLSDSSSDFGPIQGDRAGLSVNIENHDPKHWSFFKKLAGDDFTKRDVSLIDQDHVALPSGLAKVEEEAPLAYDFMPARRDEILQSHKGLPGRKGEDDQNAISSGVGAVSTTVHSNFDASHVKVSEGLQNDDLVDDMRNRDLEYEDESGTVDVPPLDPSLVDIDISSLQIIKNADLEELRELGSGTFGTVYHGRWRGSDVAIKRIKKSCFTGRQSEQERLTIEFWREAEILSKLHHPNVVAFYGVVQDGPGGTLATVTEFMVDGSLRHVLLQKGRNLDRRKRLIIAMDAAFGMEYLHSKNIVHFDLKCDNLLVNLKDPTRPICKVGDFGLSKIKRNTLVSGGVRGTLPWMAPELLNGSSNKVSEKVDVFSFGIVLWEILTGEEPYANMHYGAIIGGIVNNTLRPTIPSYCDAEWRRLMEQCWAPNPSLRPSFTEIASRLRVMSTAAQTKKAASGS
ncbi:uncharacterized protein LOC127253311 isoform X2 [Andrographis paniculata]|nr:uncharacterized protein LOC127253311 isoform X2 [Andrographis paniculata]XP_051133795.1 uncharacterized protein LOC127253311 isoform X2 [Andrographis paniculata]